MPPGTVNYRRLYRRVALALNALQSSTYGATTPTLNDRRRPLEAIIRDAIVNKDAAVRGAICMSEKSPHRVRYMSYSGELEYNADGAPSIPDHYGPIGQVMIKKHAAGSWEPGVEVDTVEEINLWRANVGSVFGLLAHDAANSPLSGFFKEEGTRLNFTGSKAKVEVASFDISSDSADPPVLGSPDAFEDVIYAGAAGDSVMEGDDYERAGYLRNYYEQSMPMIVAGAFEVPPLRQK
jgi:hypothetical protein